jgi:hypothetical protein
VSFSVEFEEEDADARFCPHCGQESIDDIELLDQFDIDSSMIYDDDEDSLS